jgi:hypothetical protein
MTNGLVGWNSDCLLPGGEVHDPNVRPWLTSIKTFHLCAPWETKKSFPPISEGHLAIAHFPTHEKLTGLPDVNFHLGCRLKLSGLYDQENGRYLYTPYLGEALA